jgi:hypothetical protein
MRAIMASGKTVIPISQAKADDPEAALLEEGWVRQTTIGEPRLSELVENYKAMGFEVHVVEFRSQDGTCNTCYEVGKEMGQEMGRRHGTVYVRRGRPVQGEDELF